jgi:hypothetical protein
VPDSNEEWSDSVCRMRFVDGSGSAYVAGGVQGVGGSRWGLQLQHAVGAAGTGGCSGPKGCSSILWLCMGAAAQCVIGGCSV